jgi:hypothetical protein
MRNWAGNLTYYTRNITRWSLICCSFSDQASGHAFPV